MVGVPRLRRAIHSAQWLGYAQDDKSGETRLIAGSFDHRDFFLAAGAR